MENVLDQLKDVHLPPPPSWWPPALGYWVVAGALCVAVLAVIAYRIITKRRRMVKRYVVVRWQEIASNYREHHDNARLQSEINDLIQRVLSYKNARTKKPLTVDKLSAQSKDFAELYELMSKDRFARVVSIDAQRLLELARRWVCRV